jgi:transcription elongation GreA/GreB family factor
MASCGKNIFRQMAQLKKAELLARIVEALHNNLAILEKAARASHAEATHESSKAENKYDTRGLEAAYLAGGQARQAREIQESIKVYGTLQLKEFGPAEPIDLSAVVELETERTIGTYFIGPRSGGLEVQYEGAEITVITPQSPLGQQLMGKNAGQRWTANLNRSRTSYRIVSVT